MAGRMINGAAALAELVRPATDTDEFGGHRVLPVVPELSGLLPSRGLRRGSTVAIATGQPPAAQPLTSQLQVGQSWTGQSQAGQSWTGPSRASQSWSGASPAGQSRSGQSPAGQPRTGRSSVDGAIDAHAAVASGSTSLLLALLSAASRSGSWCAVVGVPALGALAAAESGIALDRLALVPNPGPEWPTVVAALIDGVDVVVVAVPGPVAPTIASRLVARARQRGCVLMPYGSWTGADVTLQVMRARWEGLGHGHGRLRRREVTITARGRGAAARPKELTLWMPGSTAPPPIPPPRTATAPDGPAIAASPAAVAGPAVAGSAAVAGPAVAGPAAAACPAAAARPAAVDGPVTVDGPAMGPGVGAVAGRSAVRRRRGTLFAVRSA